MLAGDLFRLNPLPFMAGSAQRFGDLLHYRAAGRHIFQCNHPELVQEMLVQHARHHDRGIVMQKAQLVLGQGLLSSEDPHHMRQRRLAQPAFHRDRIAAYGRIIGDYAAHTTFAWRSGETRDLHDDMQLLSLRIVGKTLFNSELEAVNLRIARAIEAFMSFLPLAFLPASELLYKLPLPMMNRIRQSRRDLDELIYGLIAERRADNQDRGDLLSMLISAQDTEEGTGSMSDEQVRDECVTALLAGNETTANGLSFALWLIAQHPEAQQQLQAEASAALATGSNARNATASDYPALPFAHACFAEAMRLYPPVWTIARTAAEPYQWRGFEIPEGAVLLAPQWVVHRDPRFWAEPTLFRPERFLQPPAGSDPATRPKFAYFPFAAGSRQCIGEGLAWMEGVLILAAIARDWTLAPAPGAPSTLRLDPKVTLRPKDGIPLQLTRREA
ncbi:cytochrome P450 [Acidipila sp. EB88]|uniref:cytochrome P450 n=1 Tax=Acidipila sp. EB88 TaxID=2305226 RepID=UPI001F1AC8EC|nr:cytochrome P450 [Acidipila sp. EB88]